MRIGLRQCLLLAGLVVIPLFVYPRILLAQTHVVSPTEIHNELVNATQTRQKNLEKTKQLFSSQEVQRALKTAQIDPSRVEEAVSTLSDAELARLATRAGTLEDDFAGGRISERDLLLIILGIAALILIIVAVR